MSDRTLYRGEQGLLGLAFSPDGSRLYVHYSDSTNNGDNQVDEFTMSENVADPSSRRPLLTIETLQANHNGGQLFFGPDGLLYMTTGEPDGYRLTRPDGSLIEGESGALIRCRPDGSNVEVVSRGFVNLVEVAFTPSGEMIGTVTEDCISA